LLSVDPRREQMASKKKDVGRVASLRYWQAEDAGVAVEAWKESGEGLTAFARRHGIKPRRLRQWATRLEPSGEAMAFHPVRVVQASPQERAQRDPIEIVLGEGCSVRVPAGFAAQDLERVLEVLGAGPGC
jgi:transposase-like protein